MKKQQSGFTLVELVVVMVVLGILAATALPRFMNVTAQANRAAVDGVAGAFGSAVALAHGQWQANGATGAGAITGFGDGTQNANASGYVIGTDGTFDAVADCLAIFEIMLNPPSVATAAGSDYIATTSGTTCTYTYQNETARSFVYDTANGGVTITNP